MKPAALLQQDAFPESVYWGSVEATRRQVPFDVSSERFATIQAGDGLHTTLKRPEDVDGQRNHHIALEEGSPSLTPLNTNSPIQPSVVSFFEWEGIVDEVNGETFTATMRGVVGVKDVEEFATFDFADVSSGIELIQPGAVFRLSLGLQNSRGTRQKFSRLVFRRLPAWSKATLEKKHNEVSEIFEKLVWE